MNIKIGGEFEIDPFVLLDYPIYKPNNDILMLSSGRSALIFILNQIESARNKVIHIPFYICPSVVNACKHAGFDVRFYELNSSFLMPIDYLDRIMNNEVLLTVNYFGFVNDNPTILEVKELRPDIIVISDQVQSFWTYNKTAADYSFTSLRKHFPIPEGSLIYAKENKISYNNTLTETSFYRSKLIGSILKNQGLPDSLYLKFFEEGENELDNDLSISKAASISQFLFEKVDFDAVRKKRKENYKLVYEIGFDNGIEFLFPFNNDITPLNVPIILKNRDKTRKQLMKKGIFLPVHWRKNNYNQKSKFVKKLDTEELSLVIDQRYSLSDIEYEVESLKKTV